jgi:hypothetical protein
MKRVPVLFALAIVTIFSACAPSHQYTGVTVHKDKIKGKTYSNIFIIVVASDVQAQQQIESDLAKAITSRGLKAVKSIDALPPSLTDRKIPTREEVVNAVKAAGSDAVLIATLVKKVDNVKYTPPRQGYSVVQGASYYGFYSYFYNTTYVPGYITQNNVYVVQSNFFDVATEEQMWSVESDIFQPSSLAQFSDIYVYKLVHQLEDQKIIKKMSN